MSFGESVNPAWVEIQKRTFTRWCNNHLVERMLKINTLETDLSTGVILLNLLEEISSKQIGVMNKNPKIVAQKLENCGLALRFLKDEGIKLVAIGPEDIVDGKTKLILGLIWTIILRYQIQKISVPGGSAKSELLAWVRSKIPEYDIQNFTKDWRDGRAVCALAEALNPGHIDLPGMARKTPLQNATTGSEVAEREMSIPPVLAPEDMVSPDSDELSTMTYISYFRDYEAGLLKKKADEAAARIADPLKCIAFGPGLEHADIGYPAPFTIQARNAAGKDIKVGGENFEVKITPPPGSAPIAAQIVDNGNGTYGVVYQAKNPGKHIINVVLKGKNIANSPFTVNADRVPLDATNTRVYGPGIEKATTKELATFTIEARNQKGDPVGSGGDKFDIKVQGPYDQVRAEVVDNKNGTYTVSYRPTDVGPHTITVQHENKNVANSPYHVPVEASLSDADADSSNAYGPGLEPGNVEGEPAKFTIQARNSKGTVLSAGGSPFDVEVIGPKDELADVKLVDNRNGTYSVTYVPPTPGRYRVDVILRNESNPAMYKHIHQSPFRVEIEAGTDASKSLVYGDGVGDNVLNTKPTSFTIQAKDRHGRDLGKGGDPFEVKVTGPDGKDLHTPITDNGDGTYNVPYDPSQAGKYRVDVRLKGKPVGNCPITVNVREGADWRNTSVEGYSFVIRTRTKAGKDKKEGGETENIKVSIKSNNGEARGISVKDIGDGTYVVSYQIPAPGDYEIGVRLNDNHIRGSPWRQLHNN
eukprot:TRINITY_DN184_c0_g1_i2.p1 TRINITY_DN184_c0_g1~~TRINITY_DN184_c0_g1_i2.p1  ORF type:complete len:757 (-),score=257.76 TRINITY_DN184_c0_g1_i2:127-2397(-)